MVLRIRFSFFTCFFVFTQLCIAQNIDGERIADSIYFSNVTATLPKPEALPQSLKIYKKCLEELKDTSSSEFRKVLSKKMAVESLVKEIEMNYDDAISLVNQSLKTYDNSAYLKGLFCRQLHRYWGYKNELDSVIKYTKIAEESFRDTLGEHHQLISESMFSRGRAIANNGDKRLGIKVQKEAIANNITYQGEFNTTAAIQEHVLASAYDHYGYYKKELECYKKVIKRWESLPEEKDMSYLAIAYGSTGIWYLLHGDLETAEQYLLKKEKLIEERKEEISNWFNETYKGRTQVGIWSSRSRLAAYKKDTSLAVAYADKILDFIKKFDKNKKENNPHNLPYFYEFVKNGKRRAMRMKAAMIRSKDPLGAKKLDEEIIKNVGSDEVPRVTIPEKVHILKYHIEYDALEKADQILTNYVQQAKKNSHTYGLLLYYALETDLRLQQKDFEAFDMAANHFFQALQQDRFQKMRIEELKYNDINPYASQDILDALIQISKNYSQKYIETQDPKDAQKAYSSIALSSEMFAKNFDHLKYNEKKYQAAISIHEQLLNAAIHANISSDQVLQTVEENTSKTLWKKFLHSRQSKFFNIPDSILQRENNLKAERFGYKKELFSNKKLEEKKIKLLKERLLTVETEIEDVNTWYQQTYPNYFKQKIKPFDVRLLKEKLTQDQKVIKYVFGINKVYAFTITKDSTQVISLGNKKEIIGDVHELLRLLKKPSEKGYAAQAKKVYQKIADKVLSENQHKEIIFVQEDILHYVPMEALIGHHGKYLIEEYQISYAPSLLLWNEQIRVEKSKKSKLGIYAPAYKKGQKKNPKRNDSIALMGASYEASAIAEYFQSDTYIGSEASKSQFASNAADYRMLHLAMHSSFNQVNPEFSSLVFSAKDKNNKLYISELYNLHLNADLAVLSACNTGAGEFQAGEGMVNVSRAFTYAGVPSLVASLWAVPDIETSKIMVRFYASLKEGKPKNLALQEAKINYLNTAEYEELKHPYYWAGFVVSGNINPVNQKSTHFLWIGLSLVFIGGVFFLRKKLV